MDGRDNGNVEMKVPESAARSRLDLLPARASSLVATTAALSSVSRARLPLAPVAVDAVSVAAAAAAARLSFSFRSRRNRALSSFYYHLHIIRTLWLETSIKVEGHGASTKP
jgi:hypothetical protein